MNGTNTGPAPAAREDNHSGVLLRRVDLSTSVLTAWTYAPRLCLSAHVHVSPFLLFVRGGEFVERQGRRSERCDRLTCIYRPALDEHSNDFEGGAEVAAIDLGQPLIDRLRGAAFDGRRFSVRSALMRQFGDRLEAELAAPDAMSAMVIEALAIEVIVGVSRRQPARVESRPVERARRFVEHEFASSLSLSGIAAAAGVHPVHLARLFRAAHGCTVGEYIRRVRVAFVRQQLAASDRPIAEIALVAGFSDQSQLTRSFKRVTGQTPAAFRSRQR
jgi:AraC family transcriptional regulator